jgi:hypothetical protein
LIATALAMTIGALGRPAPERHALAAETNPFAGLGLPEIAVTITDGAFEGVPTRLSAGRYLLAVTNAVSASEEETEGAALLQLPASLAASDVIAKMQDDETDWPADWYGETTLAGGAYAALGDTAFAVIDLTAGNWILWSEAPGSPQDPVLIEVTGDLAANPPRPVADVVIELSEFEISFGAPLRSGEQVIEVVSVGQQPHFLFVGGVPDGTTVAEAQAALAAYWEPDSAPAAPFSFAESPELVGTGDQSAGTTAWYAIDLPAGTVVIACFVVDPETGQPHAMLGMTEVAVIE